NKINKAWKTIYRFLGKNKDRILPDDDFLRNHWIMYFTYSRQSGNEYKSFLLDKYFNPKRVQTIKTPIVIDNEIVHEEFLDDISDYTEDTIDFQEYFRELTSGGIDDVLTIK